MYSETQLRCLSLMKIPAWELRGQLQGAPVPLAKPVTDLPPPESTTQDFVPDLAEWLLLQPVSPLTEAPVAPLVVVSDADEHPGASVQQGQPFAGKSARMFDAMLAAIGQARNTCSQAMLVSPGLLEASSFGEILNTGSPSVVLFFARPAVGYSSEDIERFRLAEHTLRPGVRCIITYHPDYLLDHTHLKRKVWEDLKRVKRLLDGAVVKPGSI